MDPDAVDYGKCIKNRLEKLLQKHTVTQEQLETAQEVLQELNDQLVERGITNVRDIVHQLQNIQQEMYPSTAETYVVGENDNLNVVNENPPENFITATDDVIVFEFDEMPNMNNVAATNEVSEVGVQMDEFDDKQLFSVVDNPQKTENGTEFIKDDNLPKTESDRDSILTTKEEHTEQVIKISEKENSSVDAIVEMNERERNCDEQVVVVEKENNGGEPKMNVVAVNTLEMEENDGNNINIVVNTENDQKNNISNNSWRNLFYPIPIDASGKRTNKERPPAAISSAAFREHLQKKVDDKKNAEEEKKKKRETRLLKRTLPKKCKKC